MPDLTLQTGDDPKRLTGTSSEAGVEPGLAGRMTAALAHITTLVDDVPELDDLDGAVLLEAAEQCAAVVRNRFPDPDDLTNAHRAMVATYTADEFVGRHLAVLTTTQRGPVTIGDESMRLSCVERALRELARMVGGPAPAMVEDHLAAADAR
jgi:hypothetical protein